MRRRLLQAFGFLLLSAAPIYAQEDKKTDDLKPNDPDTGERPSKKRPWGFCPTLLKSAASTSLSIVVSPVSEQPQLRDGPIAFGPADKISLPANDSPSPTFS